MRFFLQRNTCASAMQRTSRIWPVGVITGATLEAFAEFVKSSSSVDRLGGGERGVGNGRRGPAADLQISSPSADRGQAAT